MSGDSLCCGGCLYLSGSFWVFRCPKCGKWGTQETRKHPSDSRASFKCHYCNRGTTIKKKKEFGLSMAHKGPYKDAKDAISQCQVLNAVKSPEMMEFYSSGGCL